MGCQPEGLGGGGPLGGPVVTLVSVHDRPCTFTVALGPCVDGDRPFCAVTQPFY